MNSEREAEQAEADSKTGEDENQDGNPNGPDDEDNRQGQDSVSPNKTTVPSSSSVSPTLPPPPLFVSALNLQPNPAIPTDISTHDKTNTDDSEDEDGSDPLTLSTRFKEDPSSIMKLLQSSLSMDKLSSLIRSECRANRRQLKTLQKQLEEAYVALSDCAVQKEELQIKMDESNRKIGDKRKQMESLRDELKDLGEEELQLKKKRDASYARCSEIKKKLKSSREAQQQIATFSAKSNTTSNFTSSSAVP